MQSSFLDDLKRLHLDAEWISFVALRDAVGLALQDAGAATRKDTLRLAREVIPTLFARENSQLRRHWATPEEREIQEKADLRKLPFKRVLESAITSLEKELVRDTQRLARVHRGKLEKLKQLRQDTRKESYFEGKIVRDDAALGGPHHTDAAGSHEFRLPGGRAMKIRVVHDTKVEAINGADLIYEHHIMGEREARVVAVQYKIMNESHAVPKNERLKAQLGRLHQWYCGRLPCIPKDQAHPDNGFFRFPRCSAFLRAASSLTGSSTGISHGYYMPVCRVMEVYDKGPVTARSLNGEVVTHRMFEDLFNSGLLGSRVLAYDELETFYAEQKLIESGDTVALHVRVDEPRRPRRRRG